MKILSLDNFAQVKRQLTLRGKQHDVLEVSVQQFINNLKNAEELESKGQTEGALSLQVENSVSAICDVVPSLERADLVSLPIEAIATILKFLRGEFDPSESGGEAPAVEGEAGNAPT
jgi:hypothetical protein